MKLLFSGFLDLLVRLIAKIAVLNNKARLFFNVLLAVFKRKVKARREVQLHQMLCVLLLLLM